jgi:lipopolysaccharide biosynthesis regulator YciM
VTPQDRRKEVDAWLARAPEQGANREPLAILAGDLRVQEGDWRGALARYPSAPQPGNRGWVALMRATCQERLGQKDAARETLREAKDDKAYQADREALEQRLAL